MNRREALKSLGALAGTIGASRLLPGCGDDIQRGPGSIDTIVLLMMENRSYDHWLGARAFEAKPGDGLVAGMSNDDMTGNPVGIFPAMPNTYCVADPPHSWVRSHNEWNNGAMDGFVTQCQDENNGDVSTMQYMQRSDLPITWALADAYATCDRWFASVMGPTWPNRMHWLTGTSMGMQQNKLPDGGYTAPTIFDRLDAASVDFKIYYGDLPFLPLLGGGVKVNLDGRYGRMKDFFADAAAGTLPPVVYLDPPFSYGDDHPPHHPGYGQALLASVYKALAASPQWERLLWVVTYDEHGGFFDHVAPPKVVADDYAAQGFDQYGFRVPTLVVGPYVKPGYVSSVVRDHTSALKQIENMFGTEPITARTTAANDLSELLDDDRLVRGDAMTPISLPDFPFDESTVPPECTKTGSIDFSHPVLETADAHPEWISKYDARSELPDLWRDLLHRARTR
jgi:phospholipase C